MSVRHRLTMVQRIYHQVNGGDASEISSSSSRSLESDEQVYERHTTVAEDAVRLDLGWIGQGNLSVALVVVRNDEDKGIVEVVFPGADVTLLVHPRESVAFCPTHPDQIALRSQGGKLKFTSFVVPG